MQYKDAWIADEVIQSLYLTMEIIGILRGTIVNGIHNCNKFSQGRQWREMIKLQMAVHSRIRELDSRRSY